MSAQLLGDKVLMARLSAMPGKMQKAITVPALRAGGQVLARAIRQAAPVYTGNLKRSIGVTVKQKRGADLQAYVKVGARRGFTIRRGINKISEARAGQYGSVMNSGRKDGTRPKNRNWLTNAATAAMQPAVGTMTAKLRQGFAQNLRSIT